MPSASQAEQTQQDEFSVPWEWMEISLGFIRDCMEGKGFKPTRIVGISRGGLIPATMLAFKLGVYDVQSTRLQTYDVTHLDPPNRAAWNNDQTLFVDDIFDTGDTHQVIRATYPCARVAVAFWKQHALHRAKDDPLTFFGLEVPNMWVNFPWDYRSNLPVVEKVSF